MNIYQEEHGQVPDLGYHFYPPQEMHHPGHPRLDVFLSARPSGQHFDPLRAEYPAPAAHGGIEALTVQHPWSRAKQYRVCAGRILLTDRLGKRVEAFSYGGDLQIETRALQTHCALRSAAPIFALYGPLGLPMWLAAETEILLACLEARVDRQGARDFDERLARMAPQTLYVCSLQALLEKWCHSRSGSRALDRQGEHFIHEEIARLQESGSWPRAGCSMAELFGLQAAGQSF